MTELIRRALADRSRSFVGWCLGLAAYIAMHAAVFPSIQGSADFDKLIQNYPDALKKMFGLTGALSFTSGKGYVDVELFSFILPSFILVIAIGAGAGLLAGEEEHGLLDVWMACPITRTELVASRACVVASECVLFGAAVVGSLAVADPLAGFDLPYGRLFAGCVAITLLGLFHGGLALAIGAFTRHRGSAIGITAAVAALGYLIATLHDIATWLDPFRWVSPFYYMGRSPLEAGVDVVHLAILGLAAVAAFLAAGAIFNRRDVATP
jgi:ABC-2 type transport system permease protein